MISLADWGLLGAVCFLIFCCVMLLIRYDYHRRLHRDLAHEKEVVLSFVHDIGEVFAGEENLELAGLLKRVLFYALRTSRGGAGAIYLVEPGGQSLRAVVTSGTFVPLTDAIEADELQRSSRFDYVEDMVRRRIIKLREGIIGEVAATDMAALIQDAELDPRIPRHAGDFLRVESVLAVPMRFHHEVLGVVVVMNRVDGLGFTPSDQNLLQAVADQSSVSIHFAQQSESLEEKRRLDQDLGFARGIQAALHPSELPSYSGLQLGAFSSPAKEIGGDYYDIVQVDDTHLGFAIADVSGKGVSGALMMAACRTVLRLKATGRLDCAGVLKELNAFISRDLNEDMFISMLYMILNTETHALTIARAGHLQPLVYPADGSGMRRIDSKGIALGMATPAVFDSVLEEKTVILDSGDLVVIYTDGVTDVRSDEGEEWGDQHLQSTLAELNIDSTSADEVAAIIQETLIQYGGQTPQYDDMTLVALRVDADAVSDPKSDPKSE